MNQEIAQDLADFAEHGVNILNVVPGQDVIWVLIEYSWHDPTMAGKLHWSKTAIPVSGEEHVLSPSIVLLVEKTRSLLEAR